MLYCQAAQHSVTCRHAEEGAGFTARAVADRAGQSRARGQGGGGDGEHTGAPLGRARTCAKTNTAMAYQREGGRQEIVI